MKTVLIILLLPPFQFFLQGPHREQETSQNQPCCIFLQACLVRILIIDVSKINLLIL